MGQRGHPHILREILQVENSRRRFSTPVAALRLLPSLLGNPPYVDLYTTELEPFISTDITRTAVESYLLIERLLPSNQNTCGNRSLSV